MISRTFWGIEAISSRPGTHLDDATTEALDDRIRCGQCRSEVTRGSLAVPRGGAHEHTFRNPAGYSWTIRCFRDAGGCTADGGFTAEATWFAGYRGATPCAPPAATTWGGGTWVPDPRSSA